MSSGIETADTMFSVRKVPWHGLGAVLDDYPTDIDDALVKSGLTWEVEQAEVYVARPATTGDSDGGVYVPHLESFITEAPDHKANIRSDTGKVLGVVSPDYKVVSNRDAFAWLDALLGGGDVQFETAGSLFSGKRVWVLARIPGEVEVGGDPTARYIYCANSHDGTLSVTAAASNVRIVCNNTLTWALNDARRTYKFRHTGDTQAKFAEAHKVLGITYDWDAAFAKLGDSLARQPISKQAFDERVVKPLFGLDREDELGERAKANRQVARETVLSIFTGHGPDGDTTGNSPGTKWTAANAVAEYADWFRRYTVRTDQVARSFEDGTIKQRGLELVEAA